MSTQLVKVFLTPTKADPNEAEVKVFPDEVNLFINVNEDENGQQTGIDIDDVVWQYSVTSPDEQNSPTFSTSPQPADVFVEVRLAPKNTPFGPANNPPTPSNNLLTPDFPVEGPIDGDTATYAASGINPLVPNQPRPDSAPPPSEDQLSALSEASGTPRTYKYAVVLTTASQVYTLDPKLIITRRHRRSRSDN